MADFENSNPSDSENEEGGFLLSDRETAMLYGYLYQIAIMDGNATPEQILEEVQRREICFGSRDYIIPALKEKEKLIAEMRGHLCGNYGDEYVLQIESEVRKLLDEMRK